MGYETATDIGKFFGSNCCSSGHGGSLGSDFTTFARQCLNGNCARTHPGPSAYASERPSKIRNAFKEFKVEHLICRPQPPESLFDLDAGELFEPAPKIEAWARGTFINEGSKLENEEHSHLRAASIGFLWTNVDNARRGRVVIGQAEPGTPQGAMGKWAKARASQQVREWFGECPDFIITVHAGWWERASDAQACALIEHELYHCAQERDEFGAPRFNKNTGRPIFGMKGHDVETFIGVAARYGAVEAGVHELVEALNKPPLMTADMIGTACGTCLARAA